MSAEHDRGAGRGQRRDRSARRTEELLEAFRSEVTDEDMRRIAGVLRDKALQGDVAAAELLVQYRPWLNKPAATDENG